MRMKAELLACAAVLAAASAGAQRDCSPPRDSPAPVSYYNKSPAHRTLEELDALFDAHLSEGRRLERRGAFRDGRYVVGEYSYRGLELEQDHELVLPPRFLEAVAAHLERAFELGWARHPFFPDMGHGHFLVTKEFEETLSALELTAQERMQRRLDWPDLKILYHAAEHMTPRDDPRDVPAETGRLRAARNIVGSIADPESIEFVPDNGDGWNTSHGAFGRTHGWIFYVTAGRRGCAPLKWGNQTLYLDFAFEGSAKPSSDSAE